MDTPSSEDILHSKALDAVSRLVSQYEAGRISAESFRVGVGAVWECLGGVCVKQEFDDLIREANVYAAALPVSPKITVMRGKGDSLIVIERNGEKVHLVGAGGIKEGDKDFMMEDEAIRYVRTSVEGHQSQGWIVSSS